jgi:hypothetical protein
MSTVQRANPQSLLVVFICFLHSSMRLSNFWRLPAQNRARSADRDGSALWLCREFQLLVQDQHRGIRLRCIRRDRHHPRVHNVAMLSSAGFERIDQEEKVVGRSCRWDDREVAVTYLYTSAEGRVPLGPPPLTSTRPSNNKTADAAIREVSMLPV